MVRANFRGATASPQVEQEAPADEVYSAFQEVLARIEQGFETGELSEEEADALEADALADYQAILAEELGIETDEDEYDDEDEEDGDYAAGTDLATFSSGSQLGAAVLELGEVAGYETVEDLVFDLADVTGFDPEDLADLISGAASVEDFEDPELAAHTLANAFPQSEDEAIYENLMQLAASEAGYEVDEDAGDDNVDYSRYRLELERDSRLDRMEAEFAAAQEATAVQTELYELTREADLGFQEGWLPPTAYKAIIGEFELDTDRFAAFSTVCDANEVPAEVELYAMRKQLEVFRRCGPFVKFGAVVEEDLSPDELQELKQVKASTNAYAKRINQYVGE